MSCRRFLDKRARDFLFVMRNNIDIRAESEINIFKVEMLVF